MSSDVSCGSVANGIDILCITLQSSVVGIAGHHIGVQYKAAFHGDVCLDCIIDVNEKKNRAKYYLAGRQQKVALKHLL